MRIGGPELASEAEVQKTPLFARFARWVERQVGRSVTFVLAIAVVLLWAVSGPLFGWSDTWQLVINTGTTIITFLMVFVIQNTQSRDTQAMQLKLDELIRVNEMARNSLIDLEEMSDIDVERMKRAFIKATRSAGHQISLGLQVGEKPCLRSGPSPGRGQPSRNPRERIASSRVGRLKRPSPTYDISMIFGGGWRDW